MRAAKATGGGLWEGPAQHAPYDQVVAFNEALMVLSWFEHLPEDEQPPRHIWWSAELLNAHFAQVTERRKNKSGGSSRKVSSYDDADDAPMMENALAKQVREQA